MNTFASTALNLEKKIIRLVIRIINFGEPELLKGKASIRKLAGRLDEMNLEKPLIVTDKGIAGLGLMDGMLDGFRDAGMDFSIFDDVIPDPTPAVAEAAAAKGSAEGCDCVIGFGGGSSMDAAKMTSILLAKPGRNLLKFTGMMKIRGRIKPVIAVPTTSGTGSECTIVAIVTNPAKQTKHAIASAKLLPALAVLDPELLTGLPRNITAATGMDALTHAVEAWISPIPTDYTDSYALEAVKSIFANLEICCRDGSNIQAREELMLASYKAGAAFTRAMVGYVHAVAHGMGGLYHLPHGLANAIALPYVLEASLPECTDRLAELAGETGLKGESRVESARLFIDAVRRLNETLEIPSTVDRLRPEDIPSLARVACRETIALHAPPRWFSPAELEGIIRLMLP